MIPEIYYFPLTLFFISIAITALVLWYAFLRGESGRRQRVDHKINRHTKNPILSPRKIHEWETHGTFNPAAVEDDEGCVHLLYRALGADGLSTIGHASSKDGYHFQKRSSFPVYRPDQEEKRPTGTRPSGPKEYNPTLYYSGGGWGGHEDPRAVRIGSRVYMTYTAFQGWDSVRIALTSIALEDLKNSRWKWKRPKLISPPGQVNKNWVLFPEKINGKYAVLHGIAPRILIDYIDDIDHPDKFINSERPEGPQPGRKDHWDNLLRGAGAPPIKTEFGWLLLYHALDKKDWHKYKLGAMLLDINDPTKIIYRSPTPILEPDMHYENDGKPGIVYASGAIIRDGKLVVYYGGGDRHTCVAETPINELTDWLVEHGKV